MQPSDGMILAIGLRLEGHLPGFSAIQTHLSRRFYLAVDSLRLRRSGSWLQVIDARQDFPKQVPRHGNLGQLERDEAAMTRELGADLDQLLQQCGRRPMLHRLRPHQSPFVAISRSSQHPASSSAPPPDAMKPKDGAS